MPYTAHLLMIAPVNFGFNAETAVNNLFQKNSSGNIQQKALQEFNGFVALLQQNKIDITIIEDTHEPFTPDSIFPNNWISFHESGNIILYPMFAPNRRLERNEQVINIIKNKFKVNTIIDLSHYEQDGIYLEGTGSMVLDRENKIAYACISSRTDKSLFTGFCANNNLTAICFNAKDKNGFAIYHTNVMMCVADAYTVVCLEAITNEKEKQQLVWSLKKTHKEIIAITMDQVNHFAGNMLQVVNAANEKLLLMSEQAYRSLTPQQVQCLEKYNRILTAGLNTIETVGGGSARCMMAEIFLPLK